jgi:hypothetical protein
MNRFLTSEENLALELLLNSLGISSANCIRDPWNTRGKYLDAAERAPKLEAMHVDVNKMLANMAAAGFAPFEVCTFKKGDQYYRYKSFPRSISKEIVRRAWSKSGMRDLQLQQRRLKAKSAPSN